MKIPESRTKNPKKRIGEFLILFSDNPKIFFGNYISIPKIYLSELLGELLFGEIGACSWSALHFLDRTSLRIKERSFSLLKPPINVLNA
jgi:hypothetical protein